MAERNNLEKITDAIYTAKAQQIPIKSASNFYIDLDEVKQYNQELVNFDNYLFSEEKRQESLAKLGAIIGAGEVVYALVSGAVIDQADIVGPVFSSIYINCAVGAGLLAYGFIKSDHAEENAKRDTLSKLEADPRMIDEVYARVGSLMTLGNKLESEMQAVKATYAPALRNFREVNRKYDSIVRTLALNSGGLYRLKDSINTYRNEGK